jgi:ABC-type glycerol-3-phosphate transport system substrate-binding protein
MPLPTAHEGKRYATMGSLQLLGIAVNRKMWQDIGVTEPPATWGAFIEGLRKLKAKGHKPMTYAAKDWCAAMPLQYALYTNLYAYRGDEADIGARSWTRRVDRGEDKLVLDPTAAMIFKRVIELVTEFSGDEALSDGYDEGKAEFYSGKTACWLMGCWIGGDLESSKVDFEIDYWPIPSMVGRKPVFLTGSYLQTGWAVTRAATGPMEEKAFAVLDALYDPVVYQTWLNAECMIPSAAKVEGVTGPQSDHEPTKYFCDSMVANYKTYGVSRGAFIAMDDQPPSGIETVMKEAMQEILAGERDTGALRIRLDDAWESLRKAEASSR